MTGPAGLIGHFLERIPVEFGRRVLTWGVVIALLCVSASSRAESRTSFLIERLKYPPPSGRPNDFRVRTDAALALGASNDEAAIAPLCDALSDPNEVVRQAVAAALKRLERRSSLDCLKQHLATESSTSVKTQIARAIDAVHRADPSTRSPTDDSGDGSKPRMVPNAKFYIALSSVSNATSRPQGEIERVVFNAIRSKFDELGEYQLAPPRESSSDAKATVAKRKLHGYYISISVDKFDYTNGNLKVRVKFAVFTYPGKDLRGEVPAGLTQTGVRSMDKSAEDNLIGLAAGRAVELFAKNFR